MQGNRGVIIMNFEFCKYGLFVHYVHDRALFSDGRKPCDINETLDSFNVEGFARCVADMGVQYLIFTAWHFNMIPLYPSEVTAKWRGKKIPHRDLLGEIIDALNSKNVKTILYTHPRDGHDFDLYDKKATGWDDGSGKGDAHDVPDHKAFDAQKWNLYIKELYTELADRYAHKIYGFYTDGLGPYDGKDSAMEKNHQIVDYIMIRNIMKSRNPDIIMIQNHFGYIFSNDYEMPEGYFGYDGKAMAEHIEQIPAAQKSLALCPCAGQWIPHASVECDDIAYTIPFENAAKFVLFNASCTIGGGTVYASGPYCEGDIWLKGSYEYLKAVGGIVRKYTESALKASVSKSFPTISGDTLESLGGKFFMTSEDQKYEYLHIMREQNTIVIPSALDGVELYDPVSLTGGLQVERYSGDTLTLSGTFDRVDSVIRFKRKNRTDKTIVEWLNDSNKRFVYSGKWQYLYLNSNKETQKSTHGCYESDVHRALETGASVFVAFEGSVVEVFAKGKATVFIDGIKMGDIDCALDKTSGRKLVFTSPDLYGGWHTIYIVADKEPQFEFDAIRIVTN